MLNFSFAEMLPMPKKTITIGGQLLWLRDVAAYKSESLP